MTNNLIEKLRCIFCGANLSYINNDNHIVCEKCSVEYPVKYGIPSLLINTAKEQDWNAWDSEDYLKMGNSYYKRASGELEEKEASKSYVNIIKKRNFYEKGDDTIKNS